MTEEQDSGNAGGPCSDEDALLRMLEALLFAATEPLGPEQLGAVLPEGADTGRLLDRLSVAYAPRGVNLVCVGGRWAFRTAPDLAFLLRRDTVEQRRLSRAAIETLAIIAYHQPVTRTEIEEIRGVAISRGSLDALIEAGWVEPRGRRRTPGKPLQFGTSAGFLDHFGLASLEDLPGIDELKAAGLLEPVPPAPAAQPEEPLEED